MIHLIYWIYCFYDRHWWLRIVCCQYFCILFVMWCLWYQAECGACVHHDIILLKTTHQIQQTWPFPPLSSEWPLPCSLMDSSLSNTHTHTLLLALRERPQSAGAGHWPLGRFNIYGSLQHFTVSAWQKWSASQALCLSIQPLRSSHQLPSQSALQDVTVMSRQDVTERWPTSRASPAKEKSLWIQKWSRPAWHLQQGWMERGDMLMLWILMQFMLVCSTVIFNTEESRNPD